MTSNKKNKALIQHHFFIMFNQAGKVSENKKASIRAIEEAGSTIVDQQQALLLDKCLTREEINDAIDALKCNKSPGVDGLTIEFFKMYKSVLIDPLLAVWQEATQFGAPPHQINDGLIKLIHKKR